MLGNFRPPEPPQLFDITKSAKWAEEKRPGLRKTWVLRPESKDWQPEAVTLHSECFKLFRQHCRAPDALPRLWSFAAMQKPWRLRDQEALPIRRLTPSIPGHGLEEVCSHLELAGLTGMPQELVCELKAASPTSQLWRTALAIALGQMIARLPDDSFRSEEMYLDDMMPWTRENGSPPTCSEEETDDLPIIRITMDNLGVSEIERFAEGQLAPHPLEAVGQKYYLVVRTGSVMTWTAHYMVRNTQEALGDSVSLTDQ